MTAIDRGYESEMDTPFTSISAIGVLFTPGLSEIGLHVYHNKYATVPLDFALLARHGIQQYELEGEVPSNTAKWREHCY